jgi:hypothetical protein
VFLRLDSPHFVPLRAPLAQMVFGENGASVRTVMIGGRIAFHDGKLLTLDERLLRRQAQQAASRLDQANAETYASAATVARMVGTFCAAQGCTGMRCRESSRWPAMENGPHRLKNDLLLSAKIGFVFFDISGSNLRSLI